jgi:hypothetical protein
VERLQLGIKKYRTVFAKQVEFCNNKNHYIIGLYGLERPCI